MGQQRTSSYADKESPAGVFPGNINPLKKFSGTSDARSTTAAMLSAAAFLGSAVPSTVEVCPGEGPRYGDFKCNHDGTHRVCAQLVDNVTHAPLKWGTGDFWDLTGQKAFEWSDKIVAAPNPGDSWCICMWATASLIKQAGCDNVHLRCDSTDVAYVLNQ